MSHSVSRGLKSPKFYGEMLFDLAVPSCLSDVVLNLV
jgi:hypothetical protein